LVNYVDKSTMNQSVRSQDTSNTVASVPELATDVDKCQVWLATREGHTNLVKVANIFTEAVFAGCSNVCQLILDSGRLGKAIVASISQQVISVCVLQRSTFSSTVVDAFSSF
jgi:hypothetical protein